MPATRGKWPGDARAAIALTLDNMGEAADLQRNLWPSTCPVGCHYSVREVVPQLLSLLAKYDILATYFIEAWNLTIYPDAIERIATEGHELAWHGWQHEPWGSLGATEERDNFGRSFGPDGWRGFLEIPGRSAEMPRGFRPPGGLVNGLGGARTLNLCGEFDIQYISPAGEQAAYIKLAGEPARDQDDKLKDNIASMVLLPFKWATVDAYFYMESFGSLREVKGEYSGECQPPTVLVKRYKQEIDKAIENGGYLSLLFHPFLTDRPDRLEACEEVIQYLASKRDEGTIWLARCKDISDFIKDCPESVGDDPGLDKTSWR